jgi:RNA polymerase sigma-70 factor (ECF subfamily)
MQEADAADVMQETFRALVAGIHSFQKQSPNDSFRGWLWTITRNKTRDHFRALTGRPQAVGGPDHQALLAGVPEMPPDDGASTTIVAPSQAFVTRQFLHAVQAEFEPRTWQAFWLIVVDDRRPADVAATLEMSIGSVYMAKSWVLKRLREQLGDLSP